jgi:hypothetical protein
MKRNTLMILLVVLVLALTIPGALAQTFPTGGISGIQVVNLDTSSAVVTAAYYAEDGTQYTLQDQTLAAQGDTYTYYSEPASTSTFSGAAILSADKQIAAVANTAFSSNGAGGAYGGSNTGSTTVLLPLVTKAFSGGSTAIGVQNTDTANSIVAEITFTAQDSAKFSGTKTYTLQPGASQIIDLGLDSDFESSWIGSASISPQDGSTPVVGSALIYTNNYVYAYSGFTSTGTEWFLPLIRAGFAGLSTGVQVVNAGATDVSVTINYNGNIWLDYSGPDHAYTCTVTATLPASSSVTFYNAATWPLASVLGADDGQITGGDCQTAGNTTFADAGGAFLGSASITTNGEVAVVVNDANASGTSSGAYNGFLASDSAASIISPLARVKFANFTTGTQVQNICGTDVTVSATYSTSPLVSVTAPTYADQVISAGSSYTFYVAEGTGYDGWLGSVTASTTDGDCLVGITNDAKAGGDASVFNTFAMP